MRGNGTCKLCIQSVYLGRHIRPSCGQPAADVDVTLLVVAIFTEVFTPTAWLLEHDWPDTGVVVTM